MGKHLVIEAEMKEKWPAVRVGCLQYKVTVGEKNEEMWAYLKKEVFRKVKDAIFDYGITEIPNIRESRAAYRAFGKDPSRYRVSSEALIRRIGQGKGLYEVNTVVDVNNLISIETGFSVGSYDTAKIGEDGLEQVQLGKDRKPGKKDAVAYPLEADGTHFRFGMVHFQALDPIHGLFVFLWDFRDGRLVAASPVTDTPYI